MFTHWEKLSLNCSFDETKNRRKFYRRKDCIKKFCKDLKELATEIINYKDKEMVPLTDKEIKCKSKYLHETLLPHKKDF